MTDKEIKTRILTLIIFDPLLQEEKVGILKQAILELASEIEDSYNN